ncbi:hypothetical protein DICSQDRAFT_168037 [Dichomitus squalens LYAD-421 SS1]|uniref:DUF427 domain-containing protein n=1 Tax=Dichomitus squalens TaxID=114155 RepID=A0A4Q9PKL2_9APHY|nr:uncharacterized protein DICSQDRAFT_168037 [Dichomitus squalens LYAD-421 SS1]EJF63158.1 hypothetical protein DICSQDRAFT_168037 [Dichomitus squalens LYAD-421 SS1]TBU54645.1 hypothetical protein BD310DRAFT_951314 [Dichomitus squalens]
MVKASLNGVVLAESDNTVVVEGNHYFPPDAVNTSVLTQSSTHTTCPWKGVASYYNATIGGKTEVNDVAWYVTNASWGLRQVVTHSNGNRYYPEPKEKAQNIKDYVAFYKNKVAFQ